MKVGQGPIQRRDDRRILTRGCPTSPPVPGARERTEQEEPPLQRPRRKTPLSRQEILLLEPLSQNGFVAPGDRPRPWKREPHPQEQPRSKTAAPRPAHGGQHRPANVSCPSEHRRIAIRPKCMFYWKWQFFFSIFLYYTVRASRAPWILLRAFRAWSMAPTSNLSVPPQAPPLSLQRGGLWESQQGHR